MRFSHSSRWIILAFALVALSPKFAIADPVYKNVTAPLEDRVSDLLGQLTLDEKLTLLSGTGFTTQPIPRLGIPVMRMCDAGQGVRGGGGLMDGPATLFPAGVTMASTWDKETISKVGKAIGEELLNKNIGGNILLGPAVNIHRTPLGGRNGEYFSEDPFLAAQMAVPYIQGMQSSGALACIKHFACNNQERYRGSIDVFVSERALREIYLPAFEAGVKEGHVATIMSSYNEINGFHATANSYLLTDVLKKCWGFDGMVMSDWGAVHDVDVIAAGNDLEMPSPGHLSLPALRKALTDGIITQAQVDDSARRVLRAIFRAKLMDGTPHVPDHSLVNSPEHQKLALLAATKGIVLLKNDGAILPLDAGKIRTIALIGPGITNMHMGAEGSPHVDPPYKTTILDAITKRVSTGVSIISTPGSVTTVPMPTGVFFQDSDKKTPGLKAEYFANTRFSGNPVLTRTELNIDFSTKSKNSPSDEGSPNIVTGLPKQNYSVLWSGYLVAPKTGTYFFRAISSHKVQVQLNGKVCVWLDDSMDNGSHPFMVNLQDGQSYPIAIEYQLDKGDSSLHLEWLIPPMSSNPFSNAVAAAQKADLVIVCASTMGSEGEGHDRPSMDLPELQNDLIQAVSKANKNVVVLLNNGTPVTMPWLNQVPGVLETWLPGMEGANAIAAILFGDVNPSGKLPDTLGARREDYPDIANFPGNSPDGVEKYDEGIFVGYRHFDKEKIEPLFPFGFGLSYTTFAYSNLKLAQSEVQPTDKISATVDIKNTGARAGDEIVELYVHDPAPKIEKALRELKGFARVTLNPGETKTVMIELPMRALAYCDVLGKQWKADAGTYEIEVGASSRDIKLTEPLHLTADYTDSIPFMDDQLGSPSTDFAQNAKTTASSTQGADAAANATDGNDDTRWTSASSDPQWLQVDLGEPKTFRQVQIYWEHSSARAYSVETSADGNSWTKVYETVNGCGGLQNVRFEPMTARYVRINCTKRNTQKGYAIFSLRILAQ